MTMKTRLVIRHTLNFIFHQMLLSLAVIIPVALYFSFYNVGSNRSAEIVIALMMFVIYIAYCIFYGFLYSKPIEEALSQITKLSDGNLQLDGSANPNIISRFLFKELYQDIEVLLKRLSHNNIEQKKFEKSRNQWASGITHDIKTPLSYIKGYSEIMLHNDYQLSAEEKIEYLTIIKNNADYINNLISDLSEVLKLEEEFSNTEQFEYVELSTFLEEIIANKRKFLLNTQVQINYSSSIKIVYNCEKNKLKRAIDNLLDNCIAHNDENIEINVSLSCKDDKITITICDDGSGMSSEDLENIFTRYYRGTSTKQTVGSTGLGMAITKEIIEENNGQIMVKSYINEGTTFIIDFKI